MPTVLRKAGFDVMIYPNDHTPQHVHVFRAGRQVVINLGDKNDRPRVRESRRVSNRDMRQALIIVAEHQEFLINEWRRING